MNFFKHFFVVLCHILQMNCFQTYKNGIIDNEFHHTFISELTVLLSELTPQIDEVEALKLVSAYQFDEFIRHINDNNNHFIASNKSYYETVFKHILRRCFLLLLFGTGLHCVYSGQIVWELWNVLTQLSFTILVAFLLMRFSF